VSDGEDDEDGSDWLSSQFNPTQQVPTQPVPPVQRSPVPPPAAAAAPPTTPYVAPFVPQQAPPTAAPVGPPPAGPPPAAAPAGPLPPAAAAPAPAGNDGFNWGLRPGGTVEPPPAVVTPAPTVAPPLVPPPPVTHPESYIAQPTPNAASPLQPSVAEPTKPLSWDEFASTQQAQQPAPATSAEQPTEAYTVQPWQPAGVTSPAAPATIPLSDHVTDPTSDHSADPTSAIDSLFGDHQFQDYEEVGVLGAIQVPPAAAAAAAPPSETEPAPTREPLPTNQKVLMGVAAGLIAALILVGLFFLGEHLGSATPSTTASKGTNAPSATPTPAGTGGPAAPGVRQWTSLQGGECIQPFTSAWAVTFTVVSCTADHDAEMVFKGTLPEASEAKYPTSSAFQKEITPLCSDSTAINYAAAAAVTDLQISYSYPPNTASWLSGNRTYYCFVDRVSGGNLPGDLAVPKAR
jgi:Septum formation